MFMICKEKKKTEAELWLPTTKICRIKTKKIAKMRVFACFRDNWRNLNMDFTTRYQDVLVNLLEVILVLLCKKMFLNILKQKRY